MSVGIPIVESHRACRRRAGVGQVLLDVAAPPPPDPTVERTHQYMYGTGKAWIELDRSSQPDLGLSVVVERMLVELPDTPHAAVERVEVGDTLARGATPLNQQHLGFNRADHALCDLVLQSEDVRQVAVEPLRPEVLATLSVDQLGRWRGFRCPPCVRCPPARSARRVFAPTCFTSTPGRPL